MDTVVQILLQFERLRRERDDLLRANARAEQIAAIEGKMFQVARQLLGSQQATQAFSLILQIGRDRLQNALDRARVSPCEAAVPARDLRAAYDILASAMREWRAWAEGQHLTWVPVIGSALLAHNAPAFQFQRQIAAFNAALASAAERATLASDTFLRVDDVRARLGAQPGTLPAAPGCPAATIVTIPSGEGWSEGQRLCAARQRMLRVADQLKVALRQQTERLGQAAYDKEATMVRPDAVSKSLADLNLTIVSGLFTCSALAQLICGSGQDEYLVSREK